MINLRQVKYSQENALEEYLFPRRSSKVRIVFNTSVVALCGYFFGIGLALHRRQNRLTKPLQYLVGTALAGLTHQILNEVHTGVLIRNYKRDQYFVSNTGAGIINFSIIYLALFFKKGTYHRMLTA